MSDQIEFRFFGWYHEPANNRDKIWGWFTIGDKVYNFWGRRGAEDLKKVKFKQFDTSNLQRWENPHAKVISKMHSKIESGYKAVSVLVQDNSLVEVEKVYPGFTDHLKKEMFIAKLSGKIKGAE